MRLLEQQGGLFRLPALGLVVLALAFGLAACGGGSETADGVAAADGASTDGADKTAPQAESTPQKPPVEDDSSPTEQNQGQGAGGQEPNSTPEGGDDQGSGSSSGSGAESGSDGSKSGGSGSGGSEEAGPPPGLEAPKGVRGFGSEASATERSAAGAVLDSYLSSRQDKDWEGVCAALSAPALKPIEKLADASPEFKGKGCVAIFTTADERGAGPPFKSNFQPPLESFRIEGKRGYAIYTGIGGGVYAFEMLSEGGGWKVDGFEALTIN